VAVGLTAKGKAGAACTAVTRSATAIVSANTKPTTGSSHNTAFSSCDEFSKVLFLSEVKPKLV